MKKILSNRNGFTLIEAVISLAVLSIGILAMFAMQTLGIRGNSNASRISNQASFGADNSEQIIAEKYAAIIDIGRTVLPGDPRYSVTRAVALDTPIINMKTVTVTVTNEKDLKQVILRRLKRNEKAY